MDEDFFETFEIKILEGETFDREKMDVTKTFVLNQAAVKQLELQGPLNTTLTAEFRTGHPDMPVEKRTGRVIGVVDNVHFESMHNVIKPLLFIGPFPRPRYLSRW